MNRLIILNGVSSSGKTTISKVLQSIFDDKYLLLSKDSFVNMRPQKFDISETFPSILKGMMFSVASFLYQNSNVILDAVLSDYITNKSDSTIYLKVLDEALELFKIKEDVQIFIVKVFADKDILIEREILRNNRMIGLVEKQLTEIHNGIRYDLEIDTSILSPIENARKIVKYIKEY